MKTLDCYCQIKIHQIFKKSAKFKFNSYKLWYASVLHAEQLRLTVHISDFRLLGKY